MSKKTRVALIFGGRSAEHEVSLVSASAVYAALDKAKFDVLSLYIARDGLWRPVPAPAPFQRPGTGETLASESGRLRTGRGASFLPWGARKLPSPLAADIYFPGLHGPFGEDGTIQGLLEMAGVPYVGAGVLGSALGMDKAVAKSVLRDRGIPVVPSLVFTEKEWEEDRARVLSRVRKDLPLPAFVKPAALGSSVGITKVKAPEGMEAALETAFRYGAKAIVEKGIAGRELECSVLGNDAPEASLPGEIFPGKEFYDYDDKYRDGKATFGIPALLPRPVREKIRRLAVDAFLALDGAGMARVDFFLESKTGRIYVNEINTIPGFTEISMYPKLWEVSGLPFPRLLERLIALGFEKHRTRKACLERDAA